MAYSSFAIEVALQYQPQSQPLSRLHQQIIRMPEQASPGDKSTSYRALVDIILRESPAFERGCWDYYDDQVAEDKYEEWCGGLIKEEGVRSQPSAAPGQGAYREDAVPQYMTFTMAFLVVRGSNTDNTLKQRCAIPQANLWRRDVFVHLLQGINQLNFASVRSDVVYLIPGREDYGLTLDDLNSPRFAYLRTMV
jgi:hypothetical protein